MFRLAAKTLCVCFVVFAGIAWSCGLEPLECTVRAAEAAGVMAILVLVGARVALRVAVNAYIRAIKSPAEEARGTDRHN